MADFFDQPVAYNPTTGTLLPGASFQVFAEDDLAFTTPLPVYEAVSGATLGALVSSNVGVLPQFRVEGEPEAVILKSGTFTTRLLSTYGRRGPAGKSAFETAQEAGYEGSPEDLALALAQAPSMVVGASVVGDDLVFDLADGTTLNAGDVRGPEGPVGAAVRILGVVDSEEDLPTGAAAGDGYRIGDNLWTWTGTAWLDLGPYTGESPQLRVQSGVLQTKLPSESTWANLFTFPTPGAADFAGLAGTPADNTALAAALGAKADAAAVTTALSSKADAAAVTTALSGKADAAETTSALGGKAPLASPGFTGTPTAPTPSTADDSTKIATTAFAHDLISETRLDELAGVDTLGPNALLGTDDQGDVVVVVPDEDVTAADIPYDVSQSVGAVIATALARISALEASAPIMLNSAPPVIMGTFTVGSTVTVDEGDWTVGGGAVTPDSYLYQWKRNGVAISGATNATYQLVSGDLGAGTVTVTVTAVKAAHTNGSATSGAITVSAGVVPLSLVGTPSTAQDNNIVITLSKPAGALANNDLLVAALRSATAAGASDYTPHAGSGSGTWNRIGPAWPGSSTEGRVQGLYVHRIADVGAEPASYSFSRTSAATRCVGVMFALRGVAASAFVAAASTSYLGTAITGGRRVESLTVTEDGSLEVLVAAAEFAAGNTHIPSGTPAGFTLLAQVVTAGDIGATTRTYIGVWYRQVNAGATGTADVTWGTPGAPVAHAVVLKSGA